MRGLGAREGRNLRKVAGDACVGPYKELLVSE
jgi:hypothetical protein